MQPMQTTSSPVPHIYVSPASPERHRPEPYSPFPSIVPEDDDSFRSKYLGLPPTSPRHSSPLRPTNSLGPRGLDRGQMDLLLKASRGRKAPDLRKELALKNQRSKQLERRALFLSKVQDAITVTKKSSPTCPLSSTVSPLEAFEHAANGNAAKSCSKSPEDVDGLTDVPRLCKSSKPVPKTRTTLPIPQTQSKKLLPSLDEISTRLRGSPLMRARVDSTNYPVEQSKRPSRLPLFLIPPSSMQAPTANRPQISVGRLRLPVRSLSLNDAQVEPSSGLQSVPCRPKSVMTTTAKPSPPAARASSLILDGHDSRVLTRSGTVKGMRLTFVRRSSPPPGAGSPVVWMPTKRHSAPVELCHSGREGFDHVVLSIPGGF